MLVWNNEDAAVAAAHSVDPARWWDGFDELLDRISGRFRRYEPRRNAAALILGLLTELDRKNCWTIAEQRGHMLTVVDPADDGVVGVADVLGVGRPRPAGPGGALVGAVTSWSVR